MFSNWYLVLFDLMIVMIAQVIFLTFSTKKKSRKQYIIIYLVGIGIVLLLGYPRTSTGAIFFGSSAILLFALLNVVYTILLFKNAKRQPKTEIYVVLFPLVSFFVLLPYCRQNGFNFNAPLFFEEPYSCTVTLLAFALSYTIEKKYLCKEHSARTVQRLDPKGTFLLPLFFFILFTSMVFIPSPVLYAFIAIAIILPLIFLIVYKKYGLSAVIR